MEQTSEQRQFQKMTQTPIPKVNPTAWMMAMREKTMPTAPAALVPSWETK